MENAIKIFGEKPKKDSLRYILAKQCLHAANYKMGEERFSVEAGIPKKQAADILGGYYGVYPEIPMWHDRTRQTILRYDT